MIANRFPLAATLLLAGALFALPAPARAGGESEPPQDFENSHVVELKLMARRLLSRVDEHRERLSRLDDLIRYHRARGHADEVRKLEALRQREIESFEKALAEIHRLLGSKDFERVSKAVRYLSNAPLDESTAESADLARNLPQEASASAAQATDDRAQASIERSLDRQIMLENARASRRLQLAQRLQEARDQQMRLIAQQQRRFQPPAATANERERAANASGAPMGGRRQAPPSRRP